MLKKTQYFLVPVGLPGLGKTTLSMKVQLKLKAAKMSFVRISYDAMLIKH